MNNSLFLKLSLFVSVPFILISCATPKAQVKYPFGYEITYHEGSPLSHFDDQNSLVAIFPSHIFGNETSGFSFGAKLPPTETKTISYEVRFAEDFDFVKGGKLPGLCGGNKASGGNKADGFNGFSSRMMWRTNGRVVSYVYHVNQKDKYGDDFQWTTPDKTPLFFQKGVWHKIKLVTTVNQLNEQSGIIRGYLDGVLAFEKTDFVFRKTKEIQVDRLCFNAFFGGDDETWAPTKQEKLFIRNLEIENSF